MTVNSNFAKGQLLTAEDLNSAFANVATGVSITQFGASTDLADNGPAIQAAINSLMVTGGVVRIPSGHWMVTTEFSLYSNITLEGEGDATILDYTNQTTGNFMNATGTYGTEYPIAAEVDSNATAITTVSATGANVGDWYILKSQRNDLTEDAGSWQLGNGTAGASQGSYFAEVLQVDAITSSTAFNFYPGLIFPGYRPDATQDPNSYRAAATLAKVTWAENVHVRNMRIIAGPGPLSSAGQNRLFFLYAKDCSVENVNVSLGLNPGNIIRFEQSYNCIGRNCVHEHAINAPITPSNKANYNTFSIASSWYCGFERCTSINGSQCYDITYGTIENPAMFSFVHDCMSINSAIDGLTSHSGCYGLSFLRNTILNCRGVGIRVRSRNAQVEGNKVYGLGANSGIILSEGWPVEVNIVGNEVYNFGYGVYVDDIMYPNGAPDIGQPPFVRNLLISDNEVFGCGQAVYLSHTTSTYIPNYNCQISIKDNLLSNNQRNAIYVENYINGVIIEGNDCFGGLTFSGVGYIQIQANSVRHVINNNRLDNPGAANYGVRFEGGITDTTTFPPATFPTAQIKMFNNPVTGTFLAATSGVSYAPNYVPAGAGYSNTTYSMSSATVFAVEQLNSSSNGVVSLITDRAKSGYIMFGDQDAQLQGGLNYDNSTDILYFYASGASRFRTSSTYTAPTSDNAYTLGASNFRWSTIFGMTATLSGPIALAKPITITGSTYSQAVTDSSLIFNGTATQTLTLLSAASVPGQFLHVKNIAAFAVNSASSNVVPLAGGAAGTAILSATAGKWAILQSDGTNWIAMAAN